MLVAWTSRNPVSGGRPLQRSSSAISTATGDTLRAGKGDDPWQAATREIGEHVNSLLRPEAEHEQSFCWRVLVSEFGRNPVRRLLLGAEMSVTHPRPANLGHARALVEQSSLLARESGRRLEDYVSFTRADFHPIDKLSCDSCAVCNGLLTWTGDVLGDAFVLASSPLVPADDSPSIMQDYFALLCSKSTGVGPVPAAGAGSEAVDDRAG